MNRAARRFRRAVVTGASSGIGAAMARVLAREADEIVLLGRDLARLEAVARDCTALRASATCGAFDLRNRARLAEVVGALDRDGETDLLVSNAGVEHSLPADAAVEDLDALFDQIDVNLTASLACATILAAGMVRRGRGTIVLVSSLAGLAPQPDQPAYGAAKAALLAWAEAAGPRLRARGVTLTVAAPGFVRTGMAQGYRGPRPFEIEPDTAADVILAAVRRRRPFVAFPPALALPARAAALLPRSWRAALVGRMFPAVRTKGVE